MPGFIVKRIKRKTTVSRLVIRKAVAAVYAEENNGKDAVIHSEKNSADHPPTSKKKVRRSL